MDNRDKITCPKCGRNIPKPKDWDTWTEEEKKKAMCTICLNNLRFGSTISG